MIREAIPSDEAACIALWEAAGLTRSWNDPVFDFRRALDVSQMTVFVFEEDSTLIGSLLVGDDGHRGAVYYVCSHPDHRRKGISHELMAAAEDWLRARGCPKLNLMVREGNDSAVAFYKALGYEVEDRANMAKRLK